MKHRTKYILCWCIGTIFTILLNACSLFPIGNAQELPPEPNPTPIICTSLPENMTFQVVPLSHTSIAISMTGLQPGETPTVVVQTHTQDESYHLEETPSQSVDASGHFNWDVFDLELGTPGTIPSPNWVVLVKHAQGVACTTITLP